MIQLDTGQTLSAKAGTNNVINVTFSPDLITTTDNFAPTQALIPSSVGTLYTSTGGQTIISHMKIVNTIALDVTGVQFFIIGTNTTNNPITAPFTMPASSYAVYAEGKITIFAATTGLPISSNAVIAVTAADSSIIIGGTAQSPTFQRGAFVGGDVTAAAGSADLQIVADAVGNAELRNSSGFSVIGKATTGTGDPADIVAGTDTVFGRNASGDLGFSQAATGQIADNAISNAKIRDSAGFSVIGKTATGSGDPADIAAGTDSVLGRDGSGDLTFQTVKTAMIGNNQVTYAKQAQATANTLSGNATSSTANKTDIALAASQFLARSSAGDISAKTLTDFALTLMDDTTAFAARTTLGVIQGMNGWIDVTQVGTYVVNPMSAGETATNNTSYLNAIIAAAPTGSVIYFPPAFFNVNGKITVGAKALRFQGAFSGISGGLSALVWTANVGDNLIQLTDGNWYTSFNDITFLNNGATQSAGAVLFMGSNAYTNVYRCTFGALSGQLNNCIDYTGANSGLISNVYYCTFTGFNGVGIYQGGNLGTIIVEACTMNGAQDTSTTGVQIRIGGAMIISNCDIIGCNNNLLIDPLVGTVVASVYVNNTYFDSSQGSCIKITGAGATVRCKFTNSQFTTWTTASPNNAVEVSSTYNYGNLGMGLDFLNCNVLNTFSATLPSPQLPSGTGFNITGAADFSIINCNTALWTVGIDITPATAAGMTQPMITNNSIGPCGGYGANTTGIRLNNGAVAYGPIKVTENVIQGNTNDIVNNITTNGPVLPNETEILSNLGTGKEVYLARATASQTSGTTLNNVTGLTFPIVKPNTNYQFEALLPGVSTNSTSLTFAAGVSMSLPAGATIQYNAFGNALGTTVKSVYSTSTVTTGAAQSAGFAATTGTHSIRISGIVSAGTATSHTGNVQVMWSAAGTASTTAATGTLLAGSYIKAQKIN